MFLKLFIEFLENCVKFLIVRDVNIVTLSDVVIQYLLNNVNKLNTIRDYLFSLLNILNKYTSEDLKIVIESWLVKTCI